MRQILRQPANFGKIFALCARQQILNQIFENPWLPQFAPLFCGAAGRAVPRVPLAPLRCTRAVLTLAHAARQSPARFGGVAAHSRGVTTRLPRRVGTGAGAQ